MREAIEMDVDTDTEMRRVVIDDRPHAMSEWISIKERLPKERSTVLVFVGDNTARVCDYIYSHWYGNIDQGIIGGVTHWMPLPEPPTETEV